MRTQLIEATISALKSIYNERLYKTERGFQGRFYCALQAELDIRNILTEVLILEMEYQKSTRHGTSQRPDIILHIPIEVSGAAVNENNYAVWALKLRANYTRAKDDFYKLNEMFRGLNYQNGFFINIDSENHHLVIPTHECENPYTDLYLSFRERLVAFAVQPGHRDASVKVAHWQNDEIIEKVF